MMTLRIIGYLVWECAVLAWACRLVRRVGDPHGTEGGRSARYLTLVLVFDILIAATIATVVTAARANSPWTYLGLAAVILAALAARPAAFRDDLHRLGAAIDRALLGGSILDRLLCLTLGAAALVVCFAPIVEIDSMQVTSYLQRLHQNRRHIHPTPFSYVVLWEMGYLPAMAFTRNDWLLWVTSLKPVILIALLLYRIGMNLGLSRSILGLAAINGVLLCHYWDYFSGVATLKNDMLHAAGAALLALGGLRIIGQAVDRESGVLLAAAPIFLSVKYSGIFESGFGLGLVGLIAGPRLLRHVGELLRWAGWSALAWFLTSGHYYAWNVYQHGNPFHPYLVKIGPLVLPGGDISGTSILDSLGEPRVWDALFPTDRISNAGPWFPLTLAAGLVMAMAVAARGGIALLRRRPADEGRVFLALFIVGFWFLYFNSFYSASLYPGDLFLITTGGHLASLRYAEGVLGITEVFLLALLAAARFPVVLLRVALLTSMVGRIAILYAHYTIPGLTALAWNVMSVGPVCLVALILLNRPAFRPHVRAALGVLGVIVVAVVVPNRIERHRARDWFPYWRVGWQALDRLPPGRVYLVSERQNFEQSELDPYRFVLTRGQFDSDVRVVWDGAFFSGKGPPPVYLAYLRPPDKGNPAVVRDFEARVAPLGYHRVTGNEFCSLLRYTRANQVAGAVSRKARR